MLLSLRIRKRHGKRALKHLLHSLHIRRRNDNGRQTDEGERCRLGPERGQSPVVCAACSKDTEGATSCCEVRVTYFSFGPLYQTFRPTKQEHWILTSESVSGKASKRNDGKPQCADDRNCGAQGTNAINIASVEQRHGPYKHLYSRKAQSNQAVTREVNNLLW